MYTLVVLDILEVKDYVDGDQRIFLPGHKANALSRSEVRDLKTALGIDFDDYFEAGDPITAELLSTL